MTSEMQEVKAELEQRRVADAEVAAEIRRLTGAAELAATKITELQRLIAELEANARNPDYSLANVTDCTHLQHVPKPSTSPSAPPETFH